LIISTERRAQSAKLLSFAHSLALSHLSCTCARLGGILIARAPAACRQHFAPENELSLRHFRLSIDAAMIAKKLRATVISDALNAQLLNYMPLLKNFQYFEQEKLTTEFHLLREQLN
jgi:hypothetical protein